MNVLEVGRCGACQRMARLDGGLCSACVEHFGLHFAALVARVRVDRPFARACYNRLGASQKERFVELFGRPRDGND